MDWSFGILWNLAMAITLTPELDRLVRKKLADGNYSSVEEVLIAALRALDGEEATLAAIAEGLDDSEAGRVFTLEEANDRFYRKYGVRPDE
jgi:putative addiction module CopG family antidote